MQWINEAMDIQEEIDKPQKTGGCKGGKRVMHVQNQHEQVDETNAVVRLPDTLIAEILTIIRKRLQDELPQLQADPWAIDQRKRGLHFDS